MWLAIVLRNRIITGVILAILAIAAIFLLPLAWFALVFALVATLALWEWVDLLGLKLTSAKLTGVKLAYIGVFALLSFFLYQNPQYFNPLLTTVAGFWLCAIIAVLIFPRAQSLFRQPILLAILGLLIALGAWVGLVVLRGLEQGSIWLVWLFVLVWGADVGAYFAGKAFGKRRLAPAVSPGKTWEGALGGMALAFCVCGGWVAYWQGVQFSWLAVTFLLIVVSVFGDLFESLLKRTSGVKDSGTLLPGHGGVLDRIDSLLAVAPIFALFMNQ